MQKVFAEIGQSLQQIGGTCPDGWIEMSEQRPNAHFVATESGEWIEPEDNREFKHFDPLVFLSLFAPERRAIKAAAMADVDVGIWYDDTVAARYITYSDERTKSGIRALVAAGLLTETRHDEIVQLMTADRQD